MREEGKMRFDDGGFILKPKETKIHYEKSTWSTRLWWFLKNNKAVYISTYSLPDKEYLKELFANHGCEKVTIIANSKFRERAEEIKKAFSNIKIYLEKDNHEKVVLCEPSTIHITSANFGNSGWREMGVSLKSEEAFAFLLEKYKKRLETAEEVI